MGSRYRARDSRKVVKVDFDLSHAEPTTPLGAFARVAKAEHRIEECLRGAKAKRAWLIMRSVIGRAGTIIKRFR